MNTPVSFNIAKLLKVKGCDIECNYGYDFRSDNLQNFGRYIVSHMVYNAPTIAEVIMWLYEKYGIWIGVNKDTSVKWSNTYFNYYIQSEDKGSAFSDIGGTQPNTPTECYEAAINYTLNNLI